ncbi:MAG: sulfatase-like hydrolase/transferase, partial [Deinococcota bacterium]|nr:sulfatase-like hydrolase/transferase [Deinococcota bacterium]
PLLWLAVIDGARRLDKIGWLVGADGEGDGEGDSEGDGETARQFWAALLSAVFLALVYHGIFSLRSADAGFSGGERLLGLLWSLMTHLLVFMALFMLLRLISGLAGLARRPHRLELGLVLLLSGALAALSLQGTVLAALSFTGVYAALYALAFGLALAVYAAGLGVRLYRPAQMLSHPLELLFTALSGLRPVALLVIPPLAYSLLVRAAPFDWHFLLQRLSVVLVWTLSFALIYSALRAPASPLLRLPRGAGLALLLLATATAGGYRLLELSSPVLARRAGLDAAATLERYGSYDLSYGLASRLAAPPGSRASPDFYRFLQASTNVPRSLKLAPVAVNLVADLEPRGGFKPHIFILAIDSLRADYLSPYNPEVTFTPEIARFAKESIVMENAFTRYGATGLSEPSLWVGGMLLHMQYVTPFYPMNALQKLLDAEGYRSYVSLDTILSVILKPGPELIPLDEARPDKDFAFCATVRELQAKLDLHPPAVPAFAFTLAQDIHISVINREGAGPAGDARYPGFYAPYASRLARIDACFGEFIAYLKARGLFDESIVVLTTDHGDSLGEEGRWGHAYTIFPEIMRVPLIVHLPPRLREEVITDPGAPAFLTDLTPSLYYLLGHRPIVKSELFGRPLFTETQDEGSDYLREHYLLASSYGPVYGILGDGGRSLYIADGVSYTDYLFDLRHNPLGERQPLSDELRLSYQALIRDKLEALNRFYGFDPER